MGTVVPFGFYVTDFMVEEDRREVPLDLIVHVGDIAYAGTSDHGEIEAVWDLYFNQIQNLSNHIPYMAGVGNHEHYFNYSAFLNRFHMTGEETGGYQNFWFSYDYSYIHWTYMSTEHDYYPGSEQWEWISQDLTKANQNRDQVPWIIVTGHRPYYCSDQDEYSSHSPGCPLLKSLEQLYLDNKVDIVMTGHMHMYERMYPVFNGTVDTAAVQSKHVYVDPIYPVYIVQGTSGAFIDERYVVPKPDWSAHRQEEYGYGRMTVFNSTTIFYEYRAAFKNSTEDYLWLIKN